MAWRDAKENIGHGMLPDRYGILASQTMEGGHFACGITTDQYIRPGADTANFLVKGIVPSSVGSVVEGLVSGTHEVNIQSGVTCWMDQSATDPVNAIDKGKLCYVEDSHTVTDAGGSANTVAAGIVLEISATEGVKIWIPAGGFLP
jgi:hypothetical protein